MAERALPHLEDNVARRLAAQHRYASGQVDALLRQREIEIMTYEGLPFSPDLPVSAINADEIEQSGDLVVESAIEPAVIIKGKVVQTARVIVKEA